MTPSDMSKILEIASHYDGRQITAAEVAAWHAVLAPYDREDALAAVRRHYGNSTEWMKPAHLKREILALRNERAAATPHEIRELPSRFEADQIRDSRVAENVRRIAEAFAKPMVEVEGDIYATAKDRARRERGKRPMPDLRRRRDPDAKPIDPAKLPGAWWLDPSRREVDSIRLLHEAKRPCGRPGCPQCRDWSPN